MSHLGIYFGPRLISLVETSGKNILNNIQISRAAFATAGIEEKVPDELKIVTAIIEELNKHQVKAREANICLAGKDLIIRTFEMPMLSSSELPNAVNFEVKKYIPFKVADLVSDFQALPDKASHKNLILYAGIKREALDRYISILFQLKVKTISIEYAAFSMTRFLQLVGERKKGIVGLLSVGFEGDDEINYTVLENGFPLFSRDINLSVGMEDIAVPDSSQLSEMLEKLKTEIRVSLDYYHRKLPLKKIQKIFLLCAPEHRAELEGFMQELGLPAQYLDVHRFMGKTVAFSLSVMKAYACALFKATRIPLRLNLLAAKARQKPVVAASPAEEEIPSERDWAAFFVDVRIQPAVILVSILFCIGFFLLGVYRKLPIQKELESLISQRPKVATIDSGSSSYQALVEKDEEYKAKIENYAELVRREFYITEILDALPALLPKEIWLTMVEFKDDERKTALLIRGTVYVNDPQKEIELVHKFLANLKGNPVIAKYFQQKDILVTAIEKAKMGALTSTNFDITCKIPVVRIR